MLVITYGTFDLLHVGHTRLLKRARELGSALGVGVSTDEFNLTKGKRAIVPFDERCELLQELTCVDFVFPESSWEQKAGDIVRLNAGVFAMGSDWQGQFDHLADLCEVTYLKRTDEISTTILRERVRYLEEVRLSNGMHP